MVASGRTGIETASGIVGDPEALDLLSSLIAIAPTNLEDPAHHRYEKPHYTQAADRIVRTARQHGFETRVYDPVADPKTEVDLPGGPRPNVIIDLSAHTDSRGNDDYNQMLSERRASSARQYLLEHGIRLHRIIVHGYGESMPVNGCRNGVPCTEAQYQANRRIEIKIISTVPD